jgi:hypothetical protein
MEVLLIPVSRKLLTVLLYPMGVQPVDLIVSMNLASSYCHLHPIMHILLISEFTGGNGRRS